MKKIAILLTCVFFLLTLKGFSNYLKDSVTNKNEIAVSFNQSHYNSPVKATYARRISENSWLKFGLNYASEYIRINPNTSLNFPTRNLNISTTFLIGLDRHKTIKSNFDIVYGLNLRLISNIFYSKVENPNIPVKLQRSIDFEFMYGVGGEFGLYYKISENFSIGSSINPVVVYEDRSSSSNNISSYWMHLTSISIVSLKYEL